MTTDPTDLAVTIAEGVPYHVWVVRADGSVEYNNRQFLDYTGLSEQQALADAQRSELVHPDDRDALVARWSAAFETQASCEMEFRLRGRDDRYRWFLARVAPLRDAAGEVTRWVGTGVDIDGLRESAEWMRGFGETAPLLIWVSRPDGFVEFWNRRMIDFTGVTFEISPWRLVLSVGDVIGKGVNAAATMSLIRHGIRFAAQRGQEPAEILKAVDAALKAENPDLTATAFVAIMDIRESRIRYASAGHPPAALRLPLTGRTRLLDVEPAPPLGTWPANTLPRVAAAPPAYGSLIAMYTDGLTEFDRDPIEGERLILEALRDEAAYASTNPARYLRDAVLGGRRVHDDVVRHAPGPIEMRAEWQGSDLVLHVLDRGRGFAPSLELPLDGLSENGRGFFIVNALARRVDVTASRQGTHVRAVLPVTRKARAA